MSAFTLSALSLDWRYGWGDEAKNSLGLFQPYNGLPISLKLWCRDCGDACYLQTTAVCQRYDYMEWHRYIRDFNLSFLSMENKMVLLNFIHLISQKEWRGVPNKRKKFDEVRRLSKLYFQRKGKIISFKYCLYRDIFTPPLPPFWLKRLNFEVSKAI